MAEEAEVRVLVPARIRFLDRWASDVERPGTAPSRDLVATVAALAKAGVAAEARVGDEDIVQAIEDQLQSFPATEVVLVSGEAEDAGEAAMELRARLRAEFHQVRLARRCRGASLPAELKATASADVWARGALARPGRRCRGSASAG